MFLFAALRFSAVCWCGVSEPWPQSGQMFIAHVVGKSSLAPEERNLFFSDAEYFAPPELETSLRSQVL